MPEALNLYLVTRNDEADYEENQAHVIAARTSDEARQIAADAATTTMEAPEVWANAATKRVGVATQRRPGIVLTSNRGA